MTTSNTTLVKMSVGGTTVQALVANHEVDMFIKTCLLKKVKVYVQPSVQPAKKKDSRPAPTKVTRHITTSCKYKKVGDKWVVIAKSWGLEYQYNDTTLSHAAVKSLRKKVTAKGSIDPRLWALIP